MVTWLHENATRSDAPWPEQLDAFMQKQRSAWTAYFHSQGVAHSALQAARARIQADAANVATAAASAAAAAAAEIFAAAADDASDADTFFGADASGGALNFLVARQEADAEYGGLLTYWEDVRVLTIHASSCTFLFMRANSNLTISELHGLPRLRRKGHGCIRCCSHVV